MHQRTINAGTNNDLNMVRIIKGLEDEDQSFQVQLKVMREQIDTLYEFHAKDYIKAKMKIID